MMPAAVGSKSFLMRAKVEAREMLDTALGKQDVYQLRVYTEFSGNLASKRDMAVWLTADARRVPVRLRKPQGVDIGAGCGQLGEAR